MSITNSVSEGPFKMYKNVCFKHTYTLYYFTYKCSCGNNNLLFLLSQLISFNFFHTSQ